MKMYTIQEFIEKLSSSRSLKYILCVDVVDFRIMNEIDVFLTEEVILGEIIEEINRYLAGKVSSKGCIYEKHTVLIALGDLDMQVVKNLICQVSKAHYTYDIKVRIAYMKLDCVIDMLECVESIPKVIKRDNYLFKQNENKDYNIEKDVYRYTIIKANLLSDMGEYFILLYQPKVDVKTKEITSCEVLSRWKHPILGVVSPDEFLSIVRELKLEYKFDLLIFEMACIEIKHMVGYIKKFSINISIKTALVEELGDKMYEIVMRHNIKPCDVTIEITEGMEEEEYEIISYHIDGLIQKGFKISIDDFGTGYSSYYRLSAIQFEEVKIPGEFLALAAQEDRNKNKIILEAIVGLCKKLNCQVVMEGVETLEDLKLTETLGVDSIQGYFYSKPVELEAYKKFVNQYKNSMTI